MGYRENRRWSDKYIPDVQAVLGQTFFKIAPFDVDTKQATDLQVARLDGGLSVSVRVRRFKFFVNQRFRYQFTVRSEIRSGRKTELEKLLAGFCRYGLYGFCDAGEEALAYWTIVDWDVFRREIETGNVGVPDPVVFNAENSFVPFDLTAFPADFIVSSNLPGLEVDAVSGKVYVAREVA